MAASKLLDYALGQKDVLKPFGHFETLLFYACVAPSLSRFLKGKLLAAKNWLPRGAMPFLIKRGSKEAPLSVEELIEAVDLRFLEVRRTAEHLEDAKTSLSEAQRKVWSYFLPRKLNDFFYATNGESPGQQLDRVFFDLDRGAGVTAEQARQAASAFVEVVSGDEEFGEQAGELVCGGPFACWTGSSFHVYLFFKKPQPNSVYEQLFQYSKNDPLASFSGRWAAAVAKQTKLRVAGGHEKVAGVITIDPSQTPSGKLCRVPLGSLHLKDAVTVDGVSLPLALDELRDAKFVAELQEYSPRRLLEELNKWEKKLPKQFASR
ncbi:MAG: hypothetical protein ACP5O3_03210 [Candidatus Micrarchaeia archaeon]|jgi:hypothetical protein